MRKLMALTVALTAIGTLIAPVPAGAASSGAALRVIGDCATDGDLDRKYGTPALLKALEILPQDLDDYTDCRAVIERRLLQINKKPAQAISDCAADGDLDRRYGKGVLKRAVQILPRDIDEYTNCRSVLNNAHKRAVKRVAKRKLKAKKRAAKR